METWLQFVNQAETLNLPEVVLYQINLASSQSQPVAWKVIRRCPFDWTHPIRIPSDYELKVQDEYGHVKEPILAKAGQNWTLTEHSVVLNNEKGIDLCLLNGTQNRVSKVMITRSGRPLACESGLPPKGEARFRFDRCFWIKAGVGFKEGEPLEINPRWPPQPLLLTGVRSADVVMTGGGYGPHARPFSFHLSRVVRA